MPKVKVSVKIAKSPEATRKNRNPQSIVSLMGAAEWEKSFKKTKKDVDRKRQGMLI